MSFPRENRKAYPKLVRDEWPFPIIENDMDQTDLTIKMQDCTCNTTEPPTVEPPTIDPPPIVEPPIVGPPPPTAGYVDKYIHCGTNNLTETQLSEATHPVVYLRSPSETANPEHIFVYDELGGACYQKENRYSTNDLTGRLLNFDEYREITTPDPGKTICESFICNNKPNTGGPKKFLECFWTIPPPTSASIIAEGGFATFTVKSPFGCSFDARNRNGDSWFSFTPTGGLSGRNIQATIQENEGAARTGYIDIYNRVATRVLQANTLVATFQIDQDAATVPVPPVCPPGLPATYYITTGQVTKYYRPSAGICWADDPALYYTYNGSVATDGPCSWTKYFVGPGATTIASNISLNAGSDWFVTLIHDRVFGSWQNVYRKYSGSTPIGTYTDPTGCAVPVSVTVS